MCGRYRIVQSADVIQERFDVEMEDGYYTPTYNAAPGQHLPVIVNASPGLVTFFQWGLIPKWAKDPAIGNRLINARAETVAEKPSFKGSLKYWRCLVLADGFYEWKAEGGRKQPYLITRKDEQLFSFAGLWSEWSSPDGSPIPTFTIITTTPNSLMEPIHSRMPVILLPEDERRWLDTRQPLSGAMQLLKQYPPELMMAHRVSLEVNSPQNNFPFVVLE